MQSAGRGIFPRPASATPNPLPIVICKTHLPTTTPSGSRREQPSGSRREPGIPQPRLPRRYRHPALNHGSTVPYAAPACPPRATDGKPSTVPCTTPACPPPSAVGGGCRPTALAPHNRHHYALSHRCLLLRASLLRRQDKARRERGARRATRPGQPAPTRAWDRAASSARRETQGVRPPTSVRLHGSVTRTRTRVSAVSVAHDAPLCSGPPAAPGCQSSRFIGLCRLMGTLLYG